MATANEISSRVRYLMKFCNFRITLLGSGSEWQKTRRYFWQWFHILKNKWKLEYKREKKSCGQFCRAALTGLRAWPIQPISWFLVKLPKWHFLTHAWRIRSIFNLRFELKRVKVEYNFNSCSSKSWINLLNRQNIAFCFLSEIK